MQCRHCGRSFKSGEALNEHLWAKHKEVKLPTPSGHAIDCDFHCDQVPKECTCDMMRSKSLPPQITLTKGSATDVLGREQRKRNLASSNQPMAYSMAPSRLALCCRRSLAAADYEVLMEAGCSSFTSSITGSVMS